MLSQRGDVAGAQSFDITNNVSLLELLENMSDEYNDINTPTAIRFLCRFTFDLVYWRMPIQQRVSG